MSPNAPQAPAALTAAEFRDLARRRLSPAPSDIVIDTRSARTRHVDVVVSSDDRSLPAARTAAVLVPIVARDALHVLLTLRTEHLSSHAGQIAFPGGKVEAWDASPAAAALREAEEEIGLAPAFIEPVGYLDNVLTRTGFYIVPVVALLRPGFVLSPDAREVADVFEVPLAFLMDQRNHERHMRELNGEPRHYYAMPYQGRFIWGVTAEMIRNMHKRLFSL